ncbi:hypothetical protein ACH4T9_24635 [Micromonospora sp. NPDC020750]|uniref:hypothetical protein n=1 Tax=unclassified Micromonospora TaxID=2617518 RepID=UPI00378B4C64
MTGADGERQPLPAPRSKPPTSHHQTPDATDEVLVRVLTQLRSDRRVAGIPPWHASPGGPLPRRVPGSNPMNLPAWAGQYAPQHVMRNPTAIATNASHYFRGYRAGTERAFRAGGASAAVLPAPITITARARPARPRTRPAAIRLLTMALRIIPEVERPRYGEEFWAELAELDGLLRQLAYATRLLISAPSLRRSLRENPWHDEGDQG